MRLLVTRPEPGASQTADLLRAKGHIAIVDPMLEIVFDSDVEIEVGTAQAIVTTSANAVRALAAREDFKELSELPLHAVGDTTATAAQERGFENVTSAAGAVDDLVAAIAAQRDPADGTLIYAAGRDRAGDLEGKLRIAGFDVGVAEVYRAEKKSKLRQATIEALIEGRLDGILVFSKRTATALIAAAKRHDLLDALINVPVIAISEKAAEPFAHAGNSDTMIAPSPDSDGLFSCLAEMSSK